jgi:cephalosporin-C deacetylase
MHYMGYDSGYRPGGQDVKPYCPSGDAEPDYAEFYLSTRGQSINNRAADEREYDGKGDFVNTYGDWFAFNFGDKDSYYYRGAYMDCVQAIRFMATRSTSDMRNLFAEGQSQGGAFTYAAAALSEHPFRAIAPGIAFMGDFPDYFDIVNWPAHVAREQQAALGLTDEQMFAFLSYFDTKNLATSVSAPALACIGLQDNVCPPHTNIAPYNNLQSTDKELIFNPELMHQAGAMWYSDMMAFFAERISNTTTGIANMENQPSLADKTISNGQLIIVRNNKMYNALGQQL